MRFTTQIIESKNRIFVHLDRVNKSITVDEPQIRKQLNEKGIYPGALLTQTPDLIVYEFIKMVDLSTSYGASSLEAAPSSITDPAPEPKPKAPRRRRTRKTTPKTTK